MAGVVGLGGIRAGGGTAEEAGFSVGVVDGLHAGSRSLEHNGVVAVADGIVDGEARNDAVASRTLKAVKIVCHHIVGVGID